MTYKKLTSVILAAFLALGATACSGGSSSSSSASASSSSTSASADASSNGDVKKVLIGIRQDLYPTSYINEQGEPSGYDIDVIKKIDELLPEYEFEYEAVSQEALLTGLDTGKYKAAVAGFYSNDDRRAKYLFPEECIGGNIIGLAVRKSDEADIKTLEDVAKNNKSVVPIAPTSGMYGIVLQYNAEHPDNQVNLVDAEWTNAADEYKWVAEGRYDVAVASKNVVDDTLTKIGLENDIQFNSFTAIKTWSLFNPEETELAAAYDKALKELKDDGFISEKSEEYFGEDILPYITEE
jgi:L-cystine transport system substrate-binding protein